MLLPLLLIASPLWLGAVPADIVRRGPVEKKRVALTFDACSTGGPTGYDAAVIRALRDAKAPATLFLSGHWAESHPAETLELAHDPLFELGNHAYVHPHMTRLSQARQRQELSRTQQVLSQATGQAPRYFRPPYGEVNVELARVAAEEGLRTIEFDVASGDADKSFKKERLTGWVLKEAKAGSIVVLHMNGRGWHTAEALPGIIEGLRARGFELAKVSDLLEAPEAKAP